MYLPWNAEWYNPTSLVVLDQCTKSTWLSSWSTGGQVNISEFLWCSADCVAASVAYLQGYGWFRGVTLGRHVAAGAGGPGCGHQCCGAAATCLVAALQQTRDLYGHGGTDQFKRKAADRGMRALEQYQGPPLRGGDDVASLNVGDKTKEKLVCPMPLWSCLLARCDGLLGLTIDVMVSGAGWERRPWRPA